MDEKIRFAGWAAWLDGDSIWWCQDEHCGSAPMQPRTGFEEDMLDEIRRLRAELAECREVLKQLYNVTLFDYDLMPEFYRKEAHQIVRETVRDALVAKGE